MYVQSNNSNLLNSLAPGKSKHKIKLLIYKLNISSEIALRAWRY